MAPLPRCATLMAASIAGSHSLLFICWLQRCLRPYLHTRNWRVECVHRRNDWQAVAGAQSSVGAAHMGLVHPERLIHPCCDASIVVALAGTAVFRSRASATRCWLHRGNRPDPACQPGRRFCGCFLCLSVPCSLLVRIIAINKASQIGLARQAFGEAEQL